MVLSSGYCGKNGDDVPGVQGCIEAIAIAHMLSVDEEIDMPANGAGFIADTAMESGVTAFQFRQEGTNGVGRDGKLGCARARRPERGGNKNGDGRGRGGIVGGGGGGGARVHAVLLANRESTRKALL